MRRALAAACAALGCAALALPALPATAMPAETSYGGFATTARATPLRIEVHEPTIPIPSDPQVELDLAWTQVQGSSGPDASARASTLWPGDAVGTGLKTMGDQFGLPSQLTSNGYPVQANAQTPGGPAQASQEPLPGTVSRASATPEKADAQAGWSTSGQVSGARDVSGSSAGQGGAGGVLGGLSTGDLSRLGATLSGRADAPATPTPPANPLGALAAVVSAEGATSRSTTTYAGHTVTATATSRLGDLALLGGVVRLTGIEVTSATTSSLRGAHTRWTSHVGGLSVAGNHFTVDRDGIHAAGRPAPIPGLPDAPKGALAALGIGLELPAPVHQQHGRLASSTVHGLKVTLDTHQLRSRLPDLPLDQLAGQLPDSARQLKSVLGALGTAAPRFVVYIGTASSKAETVPGLAVPPAAGAGAPTSPTGAAAGTPAAAGTAASPPVSGPPPETAPAVDSRAGAPVADGAVRPVSASPGLPPLGSVPGILSLAGLLVAGLAGLGLRRAAQVVLGANATCSHGLRAGVPDLRKVSR